MSLLTGSSSIYMSLKCALATAKILGHQAPAWGSALIKLGDAIRTKPHLFNVTKFRYSMYWFYPIMAGVLTGADAQKRIDKYWKKYIIEERGVRCVHDEPWVTIAESSELTIALAAMGNLELAESYSAGSSTEDTRTDLTGAVLPALTSLSGPKIKLPGPTPWPSWPPMPFTT